MRPDLHWLEDPTVWQVNRLDAHSDHIWYHQGQDLRQSLDGPGALPGAPAPPTARKTSGGKITTCPTSA